MESIELQKRPRNISNSNKKYKIETTNNNLSPIIKNFDPYIPISSNRTYKNDFVESPYYENKNRSKSSRKTNLKKNPKKNENNITNKISHFNNFQNKSNNITENIINNNRTHKNLLGGNSSRSIETLLLDEKTPLNNSSNKQEQESLINLSCEALYYYLKEKGFLSNSRILLLTIIVYLLIMVTHSMNFSFLLFTRPLYRSYFYECMSPKTKTITQCTHRNMCFCEDFGRCVTITWASDTIKISKYDNTYDFENKTFVSNTANEVKFKFGEISHLYIYDYKGKITESSKQNYKTSLNINVNFNYKKKDKFCLMIFYCFVLVFIYNCGSFISELVFGYLSDYIGKYIIINILAVAFAVNQIIYFLLFYFVEKINSSDSSYIIWAMFSFSLGTCTTPLKSFIICFYLELFPNKDELFSANGLIQSATSFSFILNFLFFITVQQVEFLFIFYFIIAVAFIVIFIKYFRENPRFYSETRYIRDEMLNIELKKLAVMQIMDTKKIDNQVLDTMNTNTSEKINENKKRLTKHSESLATKNINNKDDLIFKKDEIEKKIKAIRKVKSKNTKRMSLKKSALEDLKHQKRKCPCPTFNFSKKKNEDSDDFHNELVRKNTLFNKKRQIINERNPNSISKKRRHGRTSKDITSQDLDYLTKDMLKYNFDNDLYVKKYIFTYALVKLSFSLCYTSQILDVHNKISDPNSDYHYRSFGFLFNIFLFNMLAHILAGKFSFFINSRTLNIICLIVFGIIMIFIDMSLIFPSTLKNLFFGSELNYFNATSKPWMRIFSVITISIVNSLFEISVISYPPTLYRGKVMMKINLLANFSPFLTYIAIFLIDTWAVYIGILALIVLFLYFTRLNDYNLEILESRDEAYVTQIKMYFNKRFSKINNLDKVEKNY